MEGVGVSSALQWTSDDRLQNGQTVTVCTGRNVTLDWTYDTDPAEHLVDVEWYYKAPGNTTETLLATYANQQLVVSPTARQQDAVFVPNAGLRLLHVPPDYSGVYTVKVKVDLHGSVISLRRSVVLDVSDLACNETEYEISELKARVQKLESKFELFTNWQDFSFKPETCADVQRYSVKNGPHTVYMKDGTPVSVYCDHTTESGGWTVIQRRCDGSVEFNRNWFQYVDGFGPVTGEFWIGLDILHHMTSERSFQLRVEMADFRNNSGFAEYQTFSVGHWTTGYMLHVSGYNGTAGDCLSPKNNNQAFSTPDRDNDMATAHCANIDKAGWWYGYCTRANGNAPYKFHDGESSYGVISWPCWFGDHRFLKTFEMKIRPV
ncbi:microfibril-associated glycoprotein 4-like [Littorina saxatilis]|uniref:microfibril-associated glycoprotein 4-like n=1 Tax=Littorina saxatilis TaxID=31220 RepID=UPI0038B4E2D6